MVTMVTRAATMLCYMHTAYLLSFWLHGTASNEGTLHQKYNGTYPLKFNYFQFHSQDTMST